MLTKDNIGEGQLTTKLVWFLRLEMRLLQLVSGTRQDVAEQTSATGQILSLECGEFGLARLQVILSITAHAEASFRGVFTE